MTLLNPDADLATIIAELNTQSGGGGGGTPAFSQGIGDNLSGTATSDTGAPDLTFSTASPFGPLVATIVDGAFTLPAPLDPATEVDLWSVRVEHLVAAAEPTTGYVVIHWVDGSSERALCDAAGFEAKRICWTTTPVIGAATPVDTSLFRVSGSDGSSLGYDWTFRLTAYHTGTYSF